MTGQAVTVDRFVIDPRVSRFTVRAFAGGMLSALGHSPTFLVRAFEGTVVFNPDAPASASLGLTIKADSLALIDNISEGDKRTIQRVMFDEVLETGRYRTIVYECAPSRVALQGTLPGPFDVALNGDLTLHGVTQPQRLTARVTVNGDMLRAFGEFEIRQSDYDIEPVTVAGSILRIKDELKCSFDIVARR